MVNLLREVDNLLLAIQTQQSKYKYDLITVHRYNQMKKDCYVSYSVCKYHTEKQNGKKVKIEDETRFGKIYEIMIYLSNELKELGLSG